MVELEEMSVSRKIFNLHIPFPSTCSVCTWQFKVEIENDPMIRILEIPAYDSIYSAGTIQSS